MGLSRDDRMGDDLTTNCVVRSNGGVDIVTGEFQTYDTCIYFPLFPVL